MNNPLIHIISTLGSGGAENVLCKVAEGFNRNGVNQIVITTQGSKDDFNHENLAKFAKIFHHNQTPKETKKILLKYPNATIIGWMYKGIFWAHIWSLFYGSRKQKISWNIRHSNFGPKEYYQKGMLLIFGIASRLLSPKIIYCSYRSKEVHEKAFFSSRRQRVIVNRLAKLPKNYSKDKTPNEKPYFLFVGRFNPQKGPALLRLISENILQTYSNHELLIAGAGWSLNYFPPSIQPQIKILGQQKEIYKFYQHTSALLFTSIFGEGYPNVLVEAMAVGAPIIAFDSGDAKRILENHPFGKVVDNPSTFIKQLKKMMDRSPSFLSRQKLGQEQQKTLDFSITLKEYEEFLQI